jgi:hypothetical protein
VREISGHCGDTMQGPVRLVARFATPGLGGSPGRWWTGDLDSGSARLVLPGSRESVLSGRAESVGCGQERPEVMGLDYARSRTVEPGAGWPPVAAPPGQARRRRSNDAAAASWQSPPRRGKPGGGGKRETRPRDMALGVVVPRSAVDVSCPWPGIASGRETETSHGKADDLPNPSPKSRN